MDVLFATSNAHKVAEATRSGKPYAIGFSQVNVIYPEVRAESVTKVAAEGAKYVFDQLKRSVIVEDSGLFIDSLNGFPGVYSAYAFKRLGNEGIIDLLAKKEDRSAHFLSAVGYASRDGIKVFEGRVDGTITSEEIGDGGFGYDPVFLPAGEKKTFGQDPKRKDAISHRKIAIEELCRFLRPQ